VPKPKSQIDGNSVQLKAGLRG